MKILLRGCPANFSKLKRALLLNDVEITHCTDGDQVIAEFGEFGRDFDWIIMDGPSIVSTHMGHRNTIRTVGPSNSKPNHRGTSNETYENNKSLTVCGIERTQEGILKLQCGLHKMMTTSKPPVTRHSMHGKGPLVLEYHAPCSRKRN